MKYRMLVMVPSGVDMPALDLIKEISGDKVDECIILCSKFKELTQITPLGFMIIKFDDDDMTAGAHTYYFNGKILNKNNVPPNWPEEAWEISKEFIVLQNSIVQPYNSETSSNLKINI